MKKSNNTYPPSVKKHLHYFNLLSILLFLCTLTTENAFSQEKAIAGDTVVKIKKYHLRSQLNLELDLPWSSFVVGGVGRLPNTNLGVGASIGGGGVINGVIANLFFRVQPVSYMQIDCGAYLSSALLLDDCTRSDGCDSGFRGLRLSTLFGNRWLLAGPVFMTGKRSTLEYNGSSGNYSEIYFGVSLRFAPVFNRERRVIDML